MIEISVRPEIIAEINGWPITNSLLTAWVIMALILFLSFWGIKKLKETPGRFQTLQETVVEMWLSLCDAVGGVEARRFFTFVTTLFLFILLSNWFGLLPGVAALTVSGIHDGRLIPMPLFRPATTDLNATLALALVSVIYIQIEGLKSLGFKLHLNKYLKNPRHGPLEAFVGLLELLSEFTKILSLSFRLFGNIFAGEVLLVVVTSLIPLLAPVPFLALEIFVGFIQAFVFAMLTLVFASMAVVSHEKLGGGD